MYSHIFLLLSTLFFFNDTATTEIYTLSLHDALPISRACGDRSPTRRRRSTGARSRACGARRRSARAHGADRKSTRLNSSHPSISYAVFCLKKKTKTTDNAYSTKQMQKQQIIVTSELI